MATLLLEDLSGQMGITVFPATFAKVRDLLVKDTVVQISGVLSHRERNGERSIEVRLEDIRPLEGTGSLHLLAESSPAGFVALKLHRATGPQLDKLKDVLDSNPGNYEVWIQTMPEEQHESFLSPYRIDPTEAVVRQIKASVSRVEVDVIRPKDTLGRDSYSEPELAAVS
jgi:DNA polymerase-3 subunit alpha